MEIEHIAFFNLQFIPFMLHSFLGAWVPFLKFNQNLFLRAAFLIWEPQPVKQLMVTVGCDPEIILQTILLLQDFLAYMA